MFTFKNLFAKKSAVLTQEEVNDQIGQFAHDMNSPLQGIEMACTILKSETQSAQNQAVALDAIFRSLQTLKDISMEAVEMSKGYSETSTFPVAPIVREAHQMFGYIQSAGAFVTLNIKNDFVVVGNPKAFYRAIQNLVKNACGAVGRSDRPASQRSVKVTVRTEIDQSGSATGIIEVADNGVGMSKDQIPKIWEKGYTKSGPGGNGIGMSVVKLAFETQLKGTIEIKSAEGVGTTFSIRLPTVR